MKIIYYCLFILAISSCSDDNTNNQTDSTDIGNPDPPSCDSPETQTKEEPMGSLSLEEVLQKVEVTNDALLGTGLDSSNSLKLYNDLYGLEFKEESQYIYTSESEEVELKITCFLSYYSKHKINFRFSLADTSAISETTEYLVNSFNSKFGEPKIDGEYEIESGYFDMKYVLRDDKDEEKAYIHLMRTANGEFNISYQVHKQKDN